MAEAFRLDAAVDFPEHYPTSHFDSLSDAVLVQDAVSTSPADPPFRIPARAIVDRARSLGTVDVLVALFVHLDYAQPDVGAAGELRLRQSERFPPRA